MLEQFRKIWLRVKAEYFRNFVITEATLQAVIYCELSNEFPGISVIAEPRWETDAGIKKPDLVIIENGNITDILELKFAPSWYPNYEDDITKLNLYVENINEPRPARLNPNNEDWYDHLPVIDDCRLHFVVIAQHDADAACPITVQELLNQQFPDLQLTNHQLYHWWGTG